MMKWPLITIGTLLCSQQNSVLAVPSPAQHPISLTIRLDRDEYFEFEPVFVEWTFKNVSTELVSLLFVSRDYHLAFSYKTSDGKERRTRPLLTSFISLEHARPILLKPGESWRGWADLRSLSGFYGAGDFSLSLIYDPKPGAARLNAYLKTITSDQISLKIIANPPSHARAERLIRSYIERKMARSINHASEPDAPEHVKSMLEEYRNSFTGMFAGPELSAQLLEKGNVERFNLAVNFHQGNQRLSRSSPWYQTEPREKGYSQLRACVESKEASPYLRGLALLHIMEGKNDEKAEDERKQARTIAERLIKEYPSTFMADRAKEALRELDGKK